MGLLITKKFHLFRLDEIELMWWLESLREIRANFRNSPIKVQIWGEGRLQKLTRIWGRQLWRVRWTALIKGCLVRCCFMEDLGLVDQN